MRRTWLCAGGVVFLWSLGARAAPEDVRQAQERGIAWIEKGRYEKALTQFRKARRLDPMNVRTQEYIRSCLDKIMEKESGERLARAAKKRHVGGVGLETEKPPEWAKRVRTGRARNTRVVPVPPLIGRDRDPVASPILIKREILAEMYRNRILEGSPIQIRQTKAQVEVVAFFNRLFLPQSADLAPDAIPSLESAARVLRERTQGTIVLKGADAVTPAMRRGMMDLPARRAAVLFTYLVDAAMVPRAAGDAASLTVSDLDR